MKNLCVLAKEKISIQITSKPTRLLEELDYECVPWYIYDDTTGKVVDRSNCDKDSIENAKNHTLVTVTRKTYYSIVLTWWAGSKVMATYSNENEAYRSLSTRSQCYKGNGFLSMRSHETEEEVEITKDNIELIGKNNVVLKWK